MSEEPLALEELLATEEPLVLRSSLAELVSESEEVAGGTGTQQAGENMWVRGPNVTTTSPSESIFVTWPTFPSACDVETMTSVTT